MGWLLRIALQVNLQWFQELIPASMSRALRDWRSPSCQRSNRAPRRGVSPAMGWRAWGVRCLGWAVRPNDKQQACFRSHDLKNVQVL